MLSRSVASCGTERPRYSVTYTATDVRNFSAISLTAATLLGVAMFVLPLERPPGPRCLSTKKPRAGRGVRVLRSRANLALSPALAPVAGTSVRLLRAGRPAVLGVGHRTRLGAVGANAKSRPPRGKRPS